MITVSGGDYVASSASQLWGFGILEFLEDSVDVERERGGGKKQEDDDEIEDDKDEGTPSDETGDHQAP